MFKNSSRVVGQVNVSFDKIQLLTSNNSTKWFEWKNVQMLNNCSYGRWYISRPFFQNSTFLLSHNSLDISKFPLDNDFINSLGVLHRFELNHKTLIKDAYFEIEPSDKSFNTKQGVYEILIPYRPRNWINTNSVPHKWFVMSVLEDTEPQLLLSRS